MRRRAFSRSNSSAKAVSDIMRERALYQLPRKSIRRESEGSCYRYGRDEPAAAALNAWRSGRKVVLRRLVLHYRGS